ncbi:MAG: nucleotide exchange factor GrpE [Tissierellia bacterium]|nr:nucleotide exchange factor GrpE [Tissierellia bacterium]
MDKMERDDIEQDLQEERVDEDQTAKEEKLEEDKVQEEKKDVDKDSKEDFEDEALKTTLARLQADFQNYRNRTEKEKASVYAYANEKLVLKLLPIIDNLERAIASEKEEDAFYQGVKMIYDELIKVLDKEGIVRFDPVGEKFDPNFHQAIFMEESSEMESEHILETFQVGYMIKDKVIRPAMVKVSK